MINKDLEAYKESDEFQEILKKCENKVKTLESQIDAVYNEGEAEWSDSDIDDIKHKMCKNEFDVKDLWISFIDWIVSEVKHKKGKELLDFYTFRKENASLFLYQPINTYGQSNSILRYTELDMLRYERSHYKGLEDVIDDLIGSELTKEQEEEQKKKLKGAF